MLKSLQCKKMGGAAVENAAKIGAFVVCALCAFVLFSCGGGGGGGGASLGGGSSLGGTKTLSIDINELMGTSRASSRPNLDWNQIDLTVYINDEVVYDEQIPRGNNDVIRIENVKIGSTVRAKAAVWVEGEADARQAEAEPITVQVGTNKMTLYVPYKYTIVNLDGIGETKWYTSRDGIPLPELVSDDERYSTNYTDENAVPYAVGTVKGVRTDKTFTAEQVNKYPFELNEGDTYYTVGAFDPTRPETKIVIPDSINGKPVRCIDNNAFANCDGITSVTLPEGLTEIGEGAFSECLRLATINFPDSVITINPNAFSHCISLTQISLPGVTMLGQGAFERCSGLTSASLPAVTDIEANAFKQCSFLASVTINPAATTIGDEAFSGCRLSSITLPSNLDSLGREAFYMNHFRSVTIPGSLMTIGEGAFKGCVNLENVIMNTNTVEIGASAFESCGALRAITWPNTLTTIGNAAFKGTALSNITIPNGVSTLESNTFENCLSLQTINTNNVTTIAADCFKNSALREITIPSTAVSSLDVTAFNGSTDLGTITFGGTAAPTISGTCSSVSVLQRVYFPGGLVATENRPTFIAGMQSSFVTVFPNNVIPDIEFIE